MTLWAIVPVKPLQRGKSRLSSILSVTERTTLNQSMLINTLKTLKSVNEIDTVLVVSRDPAALAVARDFDAKTVLEDGNPELNTALRRAAMVAIAYYANQILVMPADLPLVKVEHIKSILALSGKAPELIIAPDRRKDGTNALYINPADLIDFYYGPGSFKKHLKAAEIKGAAIQIVENEALGLDLDLPEDLQLLTEIESSVKTGITA
ncbi:MAG: 2-phospho-L-lactate guanylyltransferase [Anaerolineae bacterium]|nr:2-phospho-L-lactate guanylyltransferase [Anaerolineae bacterium]